MSSERPRETGFSMSARVDGKWGRKSAREWQKAKENAREWVQEWTRTTFGRNLPMRVPRAGCISIVLIIYYNLLIL